MVRAKVVQASGAAIWMKGARRTRRGAGIPVRPPQVWVKTTSCAVAFGSGRRSGNAVAWKLA